MENLYQKVDAILVNKLPQRHSYFQLQNFIIGREPTIQGKLWQIIREIDARKASIDSINSDIDATNDEIEILNKNIEILQLESAKNKLSGFNITRLNGEIGEIQIRKYKRTLINLQKTIDSLREKIEATEEELKFLVAAFDALNKVEEVKPFDNIKAQKQYWEEKLGALLNLNMLLKRPLDTELVQTICCLDSDSDVKNVMINMLQKEQNRLIAERDKFLVEMSKIKDMEKKNG